MKELSRFDVNDRKHLPFDFQEFRQLKRSEMIRRYTRQRDGSYLITLDI